MRDAAEVNTLVDVLGGRAAQQPNQAAFTWLSNAADETITYAELDCRARTIGASLQQAAHHGDRASPQQAARHGDRASLHGPPMRGQRALLLYPPGLDFVAALFGCLYAGWVAVPAYPPPLNQRLDRIQAIAHDAQPLVALTTALTLARIQPYLDQQPDLARLHWLTTEPSATSVAPQVFSPSENSRKHGSPEWAPPDLESDSLAVLQYTSGSTSAPRGVMLSHANLLHNIAQIQRRFEAGPSSRGVIWLPPYHDMGLVGGILEGVYAGFPIALMAPVAFLQRPRRWLEAITHTAGTISGGPNFAYDLCVERIPESDRAGLDLSSWQVAFNGSEPVRAETLDRFSEAFGPYGFNRSALYPCYGLAEATLMVSGGAASKPPVVLAVEDGRSIVGVGTAIDDQHIAVVDGEVWVAGPSIAGGYWNQPSLSESTFGARLPTGQGPFLRTGDLGFVRDGELFITGRLKATLIVGGRKIQAEDIEACLSADQTTALPASVVALSLEIDGKEHLCVIQEVKPAADLQAIANSIRARVADAHQLPVGSVILVRHGAVPRTSSGKVRRADCRAALLTGQLEKVYEWRAAWP
jgi:acyl-CoA synthetase (AMP-forming)/AMP-acid ligase II